MKLADYVLSHTTKEIEVLKELDRAKCFYTFW